MSEYFLEGCSEFGGSGADDLFAIFESLDRANNTHTAGKEEEEGQQQPKSKKRKIAAAAAGSGGCDDDVEVGGDRMSHITVERNRRKQMNEHLGVLRSLMPSFYVKRGDQASIIGGVVDYINELQQILGSLETKKQRKLYSTDVSSPQLPVVANNPRPSQLISPRKSPLSPKPPSTIINLPPISPRTPQPTSPYIDIVPTTTKRTSFLPSPTGSSNSSSNVMMINGGMGIISCNNNNNNNDVVANCKSAIADVEVKFSGPHLILKTVSPRIPGQAVKIIAALKDLSLEILHVNVDTVEESLLVNFFTIKIGIECQLSAEELAQQIQQTFC